MGREIDISAITVRDLIKNPAPTVFLNATTADAISLMTNLGLRAVLVIDDDGHLMGILRIEDLLATFLQGLEAVLTIFRNEPRHHFL